MQVIYATGQPRLLEFAVAKRRTAVPAGATVFAICDGDRLVTTHDESLFAAITDEEYHAYMLLLRDALEREKYRLHDRPAATLVRRFLNPPENKHPLRFVRALKQFTVKIRR